MTDKQQIAKLTNDLSLLSLKEIAENLEASYTELYGFARQNGFAEAIGAVDVPGVKGVRYPPYAQEVFAHLLEMKRQKRVEPHTSVEWVKNAVSDRGILSIGKSANDAAISEIGNLANRGNDMALTLIADVLQELVQQRRLEAAPSTIITTIPLDRLLTERQAREEFGITAGRFKRLSRLIDGRRMVKLSDVQAFLRNV